MLVPEDTAVAIVRLFAGTIAGEVLPLTFSDSTDGVVSRDGDFTGDGEVAGDFTNGDLVACDIDVLDDSSLLSDFDKRGKQLILLLLFLIVLTAVMLRSLDK